MILGFKQRFKNGKTTGFGPQVKNGRKTHTIRQDEKGRWKAGQLIHFAVGVRTKNYCQFGWGVVTGVEEISISPVLKSVSIRQRLGDGGYLVKVLDDEAIEKLAKNDGFKTVASFWEWFNVKDYGKSFKGVLIHFKYLCDSTEPMTTAKNAALHYTQNL